MNVFQSPTVSRREPTDYESTILVQSELERALCLGADSPKPAILEQERSPELSIQLLGEMMAS